MPGHPLPKTGPLVSAPFCRGWQVRRSVPNRHTRAPAPALSGSGCKQKALSTCFHIYNLRTSQGTEHTGPAHCTGPFRGSRALPSWDPGF